MVLKFIAAASLAVLAAPPAIAQQANYAGSALNSPDPASLNAYGAQSSVVDDPKVPGGKAFRVQAQKGANSWDAGLVSSVRQPVRAGDPLVLAFWARLVSGDNGATSVTLPASVGLAAAPYTQVVGGPATIGPEWKLIEISGRADKDYAGGTLNGAVQIATGKQTIDFGPFYVAKAGSGAQAVAAAAPAPAQASTFELLDPNTIGEKIINEPGAPAVNGASGKLIADDKVLGGKALRVVVPGKGKNAWDSTINSPVKKPVKAGDSLLLVFPARLVQGEKGATTTTLPWNAVSLTSPPWSGVVGGSADIGPEWKMVEIKGKADKDYAPGTLGVGIQLATAKQTVDFGPIILLDLGPGQ